MPISLAKFVPPVTVTPGEYLVCVHDFYKKTNKNERWHYDAPRTHCVDDVSDGADSSDDESRSPSPFRYASMSPSPSPSDSSSASSYYTAPSASSSGSRESSAVPSASTRQATYKRLVVASTGRRVPPHHGASVKGGRAHERKGDVAEPLVSRSGAITCLWGGCKQRIASAKELWMHIELVHKPLGEFQAEDEVEDMDVDPRAVCEAHHGDEIDDGDDDVYVYGSDDDEPGSSTGRRAASTTSGSYPYVDKYQARIRCQWQRCKTTIQFAGLRRHIESKHSVIRNTACPKGCGYLTNRPDMMPRHALKCHYRDPKRRLASEELN
ncbi:hypothetical protein C8Q80DRAFT_1271265 [Daedaleopsis nitida]|nr:hypothetical protein C8Q80DRAFT_1271265 [Daedaleopsis nitida]